MLLNNLIVPGLRNSDHREKPSDLTIRENLRRAMVVTFQEARGLVILVIMLCMLADLDPLKHTHRKPAGYVAIPV